MVPQPAVTEMKLLPMILCTTNWEVPNLFFFPHIKFLAVSLWKNSKDVQMKRKDANV